MLCIDAGNYRLQWYFKAVCCPYQALRCKYGNTTVNTAPNGFFFSIWAHCSIFCSCIRTVFQSPKAMDTHSDSGISYCLFTALPLCTLPFRCSCRDSAWLCFRIYRVQAVGLYRSSTASTLIQQVLFRILNKKTPCVRR